MVYSICYMVFSNLEYHLNGAAVKELKFSCHNPEPKPFTIDPHRGNLE